MGSTVAHDVTESEWTLVASNSKNVAIQLTEQGQIKVHLGTEEPALDGPGVVIGVGQRGIPSEFTAAGLGEGDKVWARSRDEEIVTIVVMQY